MGERRVVNLVHVFERDRGGFLKPLYPPPPPHTHLSFRGSYSSLGSLLTRPSPLHVNKELIIQRYQPKTTSAVQGLVVFGLSVFR